MANTGNALNFLIRRGTLLIRRRSIPRDSPVQLVPTFCLVRVIRRLLDERRGGPPSGEGVWLLGVCGEMAGRRSSC